MPLSLSRDLEAAPAQRFTHHWSVLSIRINQSEDKSQPQKSHQQSRPYYNRRVQKPTQEMFLEHPIQKIKETAPLGVIGHLQQKVTTPRCGVIAVLSKTKKQTQRDS